MDPGLAGLTGVLVPSRAEGVKKYEQGPAARVQHVQDKTFRLRLVTQTLVKVRSLDTDLETVKNYLQRRIAGLSGVPGVLAQQPVVKARDLEEEVVPPRLLQTLSY